MTPTFFDELVEDHKQTSASNRRMLLLCLALSILCLLIGGLLYMFTPLFKGQQWHETSLMLFVVLGGVIRITIDNRA